MECKINYGDYTLVIGKNGEYWTETDDGITTLFDSDQESDPYYSTAVSQW